MEGKWGRNSWLEQRPSHVDGQPSSIVEVLSLKQSDASAFSLEWLKEKSISIPNFNTRRGSGWWKHSNRGHCRGCPRAYACIWMCSISKPTYFYAEIFPLCQALYHIIPLLKSVKWLHTANETQSKPPALQDCQPHFIPSAWLSILKPCW